MFNALDLPCTVFPVTQVDARVDVKPANFKPMSHWDLDVYTKYDPVVCDGMPVTLQMLVQSFGYGRCLRVTHLLAVAASACAGKKKQC